MPDFNSYAASITAVDRDLSNIALRSKLSFRDLKFDACVMFKTYRMNRANAMLNTMIVPKPISPLMTAMMQSVPSSAYCKLSTTSVSPSYRAPKTLANPGLGSCDTPQRPLAVLHI